jgi:serine/threonine protein kinase
VIIIIYSVFAESTELWKWEKKSRRHEEKFDKLIRHGCTHPDDILEINGVRVCLEKEFLIGEGGQSDGVYVALGTDGSEKAVILFLKATRGHLAEKEKELLTTCENKSYELSHVIKYWFLDDKSHKTFAFLIMELCEETLETFVSDNSLADLTKSAPDIIQEILRGLVSLHRKPKRILHRDLKPLNILRNVHGNWLLADFGIGRILPDDDKSTLLSMQRGTKMWMAVESYKKTHDGKVHYKTKSDIQVGFCQFFCEFFVAINLYCQHARSEGTMGRCQLGPALLISLF